MGNTIDNRNGKTRQRYEPPAVSDHGDVRRVTRGKTKDAPEDDNIVWGVVPGMAVPPRRE